jgi:hypothetical protein
MGQLILKRASASRPSGEWNDDDYDVIADSLVVRPHHEGGGSAGRITMAVDTIALGDDPPSWRVALLICVPGAGGSTDPPLAKGSRGEYLCKEP